MIQDTMSSLSEIGRERLSQKWMKASKVDGGGKSG